MGNKITRREFMKKSAFGVAAGTIALSSLDIARLVAQSSRAKKTKIGDDVVVKLADEKNKALEKVGGSVLLDDENILIRESETEFKGINLICGHKGCTVEYNGTKFVCPCHGSEYDMTGKVTEGSSKKDLKTYETIYDPAAKNVTVRMPKQEDKTDK